MHSEPITIFVSGLPKGQPRPRAFARNGMVRMYDPATAEGWKSAIADEWRRSVPNHRKIEGPVSLALDFFMPRPKAHFNRYGLKPLAPVLFMGKPDLDNLEKAVCDALTQLGVWDDDCQVVKLSSSKSYANPGESAGCKLTLTVIDTNQVTSNQRKNTNDNDSNAETSPQLQLTEAGH